MMKIILIISIVASLSACVTVPSALQLPENTENVALEQYQVNSNSSENNEATGSEQSLIGKSARWGGTIASVENLKDATVIEVVGFPLKSNAKPKASNETLGRFKLYYPGLLEPMIYKVGMSITAIGTISATELGKIGEHEYIFPVIQASHVHLWKAQSTLNVRVEHDPFHSLSWPYYSRAFNQYPYSRVQVIHRPAKSRKQSDD